jgi:hypothetical protein
MSMTSGGAALGVCHRNIICDRIVQRVATIVCGTGAATAQRAQQRAPHTAHRTPRTAHRDGASSHRLRERRPSSRSTARLAGGAGFGATEESSMSVLRQGRGLRPARSDRGWRMHDRCATTTSSVRLFARDETRTSPAPFPGRREP